MLGRSAWGVFWMFRNLERAENTARLLDAGFRIALTRGTGTGGAQAQSGDAPGDEWRSVLITLGQDKQFAKSVGDYAGRAVCNHILCDRDNPGSILNMIEAARTNARMVRTALTREVWEATNESWMALTELLSREIRLLDLGAVLHTIRRHTSLVRGAMEGTMLRNEIFNFARVGIFIERADNTARILDVKYHVLLPSLAWVGSPLDHMQWEMVLRAVSGERAFRWLNAGALEPRGIVRFLILDGRFPRSLAFCLDKLRSNLTSLGREYGQSGRAHELLAQNAERLNATGIAAIFEYGLHEFITDFLASNQELASAIAADYRFMQ